MCSLKLFRILIPWTIFLTFAFVIFHSTVIAYICGSFVVVVDKTDFVLKCNFYS